MAMDAPLGVLGAALGVLLILGAAVFLSLRPRKPKARKEDDAPPWAPDPSLADGHKPPDAAALSIQLLGLTRQLLGAKGAVILVPAEGGWKVALVSPGLMASFSRVLPLKEGILGLAYDGEKEIAADPVQPQAVGYLPGQQSPVSLAVAPLTHRGHIRGLLACHRESGRAFEEKDMAILRRCSTLLDGWETYAAQMGAVGAARDQQERLARGLEAMLSEGKPEELPGHMLDALFDLFPATYGFCIVQDPALNFFCFSTKRIPEDFPFRYLGENTWAYYVLAKGKAPLYLDGSASLNTAMPILCEGEPFPAGATAFLCPLATGEQFFGVAGILGKPEEAFAEEDRRAAEHFIRQAAALVKLSALNTFNEANSIKDGLTGLFNRKYFEEQIGKEMARSQRESVPLGLLMLDVDHFKKVNDTFGHPAGDLVLRAVADAARAAVRKVDIVCRYGGEEFVVILPVCPVAEAREVAERVRMAVESLPGGPGSLPAPVTVSVGVAAYPHPFSSPTGLTKGADAALYSAKSKGRNRVEVATR